MATLQQLEEGLRKADAAGNAADAKAFAAAIMQLRQQPATQPSVPAGAQQAADMLSGQVRQAQFMSVPMVGPLLASMAAPAEAPKPGTSQQRYDTALGTIRKQYYPQMSDAQWAEYSKKAFPPVSVGNQLGQGLTWGLQDEAGALAGALGNPMQFGQRWNDFLAMEQARRDLGAEQNGPAGGVAEFAGGMLSGGPANAQNAVKQAIPLGERMIQGGLNAGGQAAAYGFGSTDGNFADRVRGATAQAAVAAPIGVAAPVVGNWLANQAAQRAQRKATSTAIQATPSAADLKAQASALFNQANGSNITVTDNAYFRMLGDVQQATQRFRPNANLDPKATGALQVLMDTADALSSGQNVAVDIQDLHILRQAAQKAMLSAEGRDATIAGKIIDQIDNFVSTLKPSDIAGGADPKQAANSLMKAISMWGRAGKMSLIEEAIRQGEVAASGPQNGIQNAFRSIVKNKAVWSRFSPAEQQAIKEVALGTASSNILKWFGKFRGVIGFGTGSVLGIPAGPYAPVVGMATVVGAKAAEKGSEALTNAAANRAVRVMGTPNIPVIPRPPPTLPTLPENLLKRIAVGTGAMF